ncbi:hypothetical protein AB205_0023920 [Aquarana catesbeiana]|uniref:Uncharacterized protein n=1 Tax=Aquarana catesbeiana TaxID=8400 RepID=A0A2G9RTA1_AQUCT|nr:hypothetical protein AB205_0023920 [Aquarana catesbeiana]
MSLFHTQESFSQEETVESGSQEVAGNPPSVQEDYAYMTAHKILEMEEGQRLLCEEVILQALNKGLREKLTSQSNICELNHGPPPPATPEPQPGRKLVRKTRE